MKYAVFIIPFILSRLIFLTYFSVNVNQMIMEQQMATCEGSFFIDQERKSVSLLKLPDLIIQGKWTLSLFSKLENCTELEYKPRR